MTQSAIVMGGGLAGIAAAIRLAEHDINVKLIETRQRLGGRATSFNDPQTGEDLDNCQHVLLGCCTNLIDLYQRLGTLDQIAWHKELHFYDKHHHHDIFVADDLPAPVHLTKALLSMKTLSLMEKAAISFGFYKIMRLTDQQCVEMDTVNFGTWLRKNGQPEGAINKFWDIIVTSALNLSVHQSSARYAIQVFREGFMAHTDAYVMGVSRVPLVRLYDRAVDAIREKGGQVLLSTSINQIRFDGTKVTGVETSDETHTAEFIVNAMPFDRLQRVANPALIEADPRLQVLQQFEVSPIIGIHLWFNQPVMDVEHMIYVDSPLQWIFNKSFGQESDIQHLHGVISAADAWVSMSQDEIIEMTLKELQAYLPHVTPDMLIRGKVLKEKRATFAVKPGVDQIRAKPAGNVSNLFIAGDWADSGWPATMEGATRSGYLAAGALLNRNLLIDDLQPSELFDYLTN